MTDTPPHIHQLQLAVFNRKTTGERIAICLEMMEEGRQQLRSSIQRKYPDWSEADVIAETFRRLYRDDFPPDKLGEIAEAILKMHHQATP